jgi:hypothetical protein
MSKKIETPDKIEPPVLDHQIIIGKCGILISESDLRRIEELVVDTDNKLTELFVQPLIGRALSIIRRRELLKSEQTK